MIMPMWLSGTGVVNMASGAGVLSMVSGAGVGGNGFWGRRLGYVGGVD